MTIIHSTSTFNVHATLNDWMTTDLAALTRPSWLPSYKVVDNRPEVENSLPAFSLEHLDVGVQDLYQGRNAEAGVVAVSNLAIMEVGCWVSRSDQRRYKAQLRTMISMVQAVYVDGGKGILIKDYQSSLTSPSNTTYRVTLRDASVAVPAPDPNPDIEWRRVLIEYEWKLRSTN